MGEATARALAELAWAAQDSFLLDGRHALHREEEFHVTGALPAADAALAVSTAVVSAEVRPSPRHGTVTVLVVATRLVDPAGSVVAVNRSTTLVDGAAWSTALSV